MKSDNGFTLLEITIAILIVGILTAVAVPLLSGRINARKWSEAKVAMGVIASSLQSYAAEKGSFTQAPTLAELGIPTGALDGTYFSHQAYAITSASAVDGRVTFEITCTAASSTCNGKPCNPAAMTLASNAENNYGTTFAEGNGG